MVVLECNCTNQNGKPVIVGEAEIMAPTVKVRRAQAPLPQMHLHRLERFDQLLSLVKGLPAMRCAVVFPEDAATLKAALNAAHEGLIMPVLIGCRERISALGQQLNLDLLECLWREAESPAHAASIAVEMARDGEVAAIMQGSIPVHVLMQKALRHAGGLRTTRRVSHAYLADVPNYPQPVMITDAEVNVRPSLDDRRDIVQNAIDLAHLLKFAAPRVAVLSAAEDFNSNLDSSTTAAVLCKMHERGNITGALVDGPMTFDAAVRPDVAHVKYPNSPVAGQANILMVPNLEAANMLVKQLGHFAHADIAGIVLGAKVPIMLINPIDTPRTRLATSAMARLVAHSCPKATA
jgi:phosphotransacetylase